MYQFNEEFNLHSQFYLCAKRSNRFVKSSNTSAQNSLGYQVTNVNFTCWFQSVENYF